MPPREPKREQPLRSRPPAISPCGARAVRTVLRSVPVNSVFSTGLSARACSRLSSSITIAPSGITVWDLGRQLCTLFFRGRAGYCGVLVDRDGFSPLVRKTTEWTWALTPSISAGP